MLKITRSAKNMLLAIVDDAKVGSIVGGSDCEDETVKRLPLISKNLN